MIGTDPIWLDALHLADDHLLARLSVAHGTDSAAKSPRSGEFESGARIARRPWCPVDGQRLADYRLRIGRHEAHDTVGVISIPPLVVERLRLAYGLSREGGQKRAVQELTAAADAVRDELRRTARWTLEAFELANSPFSTGEGGVENTTTNTTTQRRVGLHLDSWDRLPPSERWRGSNRICINLGTGWRALQFVPVQAADLVRALRARGFDIESEEALRDSTGRFDLARRCLEEFSDAPVLRVALAPGDGYIAPTENLIHDGAVDSDHRDLTLTIRGFLRPM